MANYTFENYYMNCNNCATAAHVRVSKLQTGGLLIWCDNCHICLARANTWEDLE